MTSSLCSNIASYQRLSPKDSQSLEMTFTLRRATEQDLSALNAIEISAASVFERIPELADLKTFHSSPEQIQKWFSNGRIYVAEDLGKVVGFVAAVPMDTAIYIAEISTVVESQGKGVGSALFGAVTKWAREESVLAKSKPRISLTTYREVPWNAPWYRKLGFKEVDAATIGPKHNAKMLYDKEERSLVRPGYTRCCMLWEER